MMTYEALDICSEKYFFPETRHNNSAYEFGRTQLGEDRYLTHLFMINAQKRGATGYQSAARCETEGVPSFYSLMKQRRRWLLGSIANNMEMYTDVQLWKRHAFPIFFSSLRQFTGPPIVIFYIQIAKVIIGEESTVFWWYLPAIVILGSSYLFLIANTFRIQHRRIVVFYPALLILLPLFMLFVEIYSCLTLRQQTWGGPRVSSEDSDAETQSKFRHSINHSMRTRTPSLI
jgi:chitin synthase